MENIFQKRRQRLNRAIGPAGLLLINPPAKLRNGDGYYRYRAASNVLYLTDCDQEGLALLMIGGETPSTWLFANEPNPLRTTWDGPLPDFATLQTRYGVDGVLDLKDLESKVAELTAACDTLYVDFENDPRARSLADSLNAHRRKAIRRGATPLETLRDAAIPLAELRLIKDEEDLARMRQAAVITLEAHVEAMRACRAGLNEREIEALIDFTFRRRGGSGGAYTSIVGGGANACILHYKDNNNALVDGDLLLIDAGVEFGNYAADVTRTFPVNGRFSPAQKEIYEIVLDSQLKGIAAARPGKTFRDVHVASSLALAEGLVRLGICKGEPEKLLEDPTFKRYYPHNTGHWLGLDVHDVGAYSRDGQSRPLEAGMVMTVEPGLYFPAEFDEVPERFRGIGIRIEDDILVTTDQPEVLTGDIPKTIPQIESTMSGTSFYPLDTQTATA